MIGEENLPGTFKFSEILAAAEPQEVLKVQHIQDKMQFDDPVCIQFTSVSLFTTRRLHLLLLHSSDLSSKNGKRCRIYAK